VLLRSAASRAAPSGAPQSMMACRLEHQGCNTPAVQMQPGQQDQCCIAHAIDHMAARQHSPQTKGSCMHTGSGLVTWPGAEVP
jgi:hypothetical protein